MQKAFSLLSRHMTMILMLMLGLAIDGTGQTCSGSFGDPVVNITFGSGSNPGAPLAAAGTTYGYTSDLCPSDGYYTLVNSTSGCSGNTWLTIPKDHTGDPNGYFMLINASYQPGVFYQQTVTDLCANTTYRFSAWITNVLIASACQSNGIHPNITFTISSARTGIQMASYNTLDIPVINPAKWVQYSLDFAIPTGETDIVLTMTNNAPGGCGNDLALDDITFSPCGPKALAGINSSTGSPATGFCVDHQTDLDLQGAISTGYSTPAYQWQLSTDSGVTWTDIPGATGTLYTRPPSAAAGLFEYRLLVGDGGNILRPTCRVASNIVSVTVNPKPIPAAAGNSPVCEGSATLLSASDGVTYDWTGPNAFTASGPTPGIPVTSLAAAGTYTVNVTSAAGCTQSDHTTLVVIPAPIANFNVPSPACENSILQFSNLSSAAGQTIVKWKWDFGDGSVDSIEKPFHVYTSPGNYPATLVVTTDKGCSNTIVPHAVDVSPKPHADFSLPRICLADPAALFNDLSAIGDGSESSFTRVWDFGDPAATPANPNTSGQKDPTHHYTAAGPYTVKLTVTSGKGCTTDTIKTFTVNGSNPQPVFTLDQSLLCSNTPVSLRDASSVSPGNIIRVEIYWDYQNDPAVNTIDTDPAPGKKYTHVYPWFGSPATKDYQIRYIVYSGITCVQEKQQTITVHASPVTTFDPLQPVCEETAPFQITQGHETAGLPGQGAYSGAGIGEDGMFTPAIARPGTADLRYTFTADNGCTASSDQTILVYPAPHADAGLTEYLLEGADLRLSGSGSGNGVSFSWSPADSILDDPRSAQPRVSPHEDLVYTLTVTSADGCSDTAQVRVIVLKIPIVPNAFSPNGDGINDTWVIRYLDEYPAADIQVFNRYGQPVYHATRYSTPWNGTYNGRPLPVGTYYWIINPKNGRKQINGSVTILR